MKRYLTFSPGGLAISMLVLGLLALAITPTARADGATQIAGVGYFAEAGDCTDSEGDGSDFALTMTGDLEGCLYIFVATAECSPGGTYHETGPRLSLTETGPARSRQHTDSRRRWRIVLTCLQSYGAVANTRL